MIFGAHDLTIGAVYFPPQYVAVGVGPITLKMWEYIDVVLRHTPARSLPYIGGDFNGRLGIDKTTGRVVESDSVGLCKPEMENPKGLAPVLLHHAKGPNVRKANAMADNTALLLIHADNIILGSAEEQ